MTNINALIEQKKIENEFQNRESPSKHEGPVANYQHLVDELKQLSNKRKSFNFQAELLEERLRKLQRNFYDDMRIIDTDHKGYDGEVFPWKSESEYTRNKYSYWSIVPYYLRLTKPQIWEVAIRKEGNQKQIAVLDNICRRILNLEDMAKTIAHRQRDIKQELTSDYGQTQLALSVPVDD